MTNQTKSQLQPTQEINSSHKYLATSHSLFDRQLIYLCLGVLFVVYGLLTLNGYGNHDDIYRMISTWRTWLSEGRYVPSRFQGYLVPEIAIGLSSQLGDYYLSNLVSTLQAIASLFLFYRLLRRVTSPLTAALAAAAVGANPYWIIAATTSTDYIYPAFFFLLGVWLLINERIRLAGLVFALAVSARLTYGPMVTIAFGFYLPYLQQRRELGKRFFQGILLFLFASATLYLPVFFASGMTLSFLKYADDTSGGAVGTIARFVYKNVYFWGLPTFIVLGVFLIQERQFYWSQIRNTPFRQATPERLVFHAVLWCLIYNELLFAKLPHQYQYLIPVLFCVAFLIAQLPNLRKQVIFLSLIIALHTVHALVNLDILQTYQTGENNQTIHSDGAVIQPSIKPGVLLRDYGWRSIYQRRFTNEFNQRWQHFGKPLRNPL